MTTRVRDTNRAKLMRAEQQVHAMLDVLRHEETGECATATVDGWGLAGLGLAHDYAHRVTAMVNAPDHGCEFARSYLYFIERLFPEGDIVEKARESFDAEQVMYSPLRQTAAARKQITRLRSDVLKADPNAQVIPDVRVIFANDPEDFTGTTYDVFEGALSTRHTDPFVGYAGPRRKKLMLTGDQLRYVEGKMIRDR